MQMNEKLYRYFLEEMHELERFRMEYAARHPSASLDRDDPDIKRLVEALAFFAARTHNAGLNNIVSARLRIFQQFFPFLLSPLPVMGMLQAVPTGRFSETAILPRGSQILISPGGNKKAAVFRTMKDLRILPVSLTETKLLLLPDRGFRLLICIESMYDRTDDIGKISFNIDHLNNYQASLLIFDNLRNHMKRAMVVFDKKADENSKGTSCSIIFGNDSEQSKIQKREMHPLQKARFFFQLPQQDLFMIIDMPDRKKTWKKFTICIDLDDKWPGKLIINKDIFKLHAVPMENLIKEATIPLIYDGTKESFMIRHPELDKGYELQSVKGVYQIKDGAMLPLKPGILSGGEGSYEIERKTGKSGKTQYWLHLHYSKAFMEPVTIVVEVLWYQPGFSKMISDQLKALPYSRDIAGVNWEICDTIVPHRKSNFQENMDGFMHLLTIKNKSILTYDDITSLLELLGSVWKGHFKPIKDLFYDLRVEHVSSGRGKDLSGLIKFVYYLKFHACEQGMIPLIKTFTEQVEKILDSWISDAVIETGMEIDAVQ